MNFDTSVWRDQKTLAWFDAVPENPKMNRWDIGATSVTAAQALSAAGLPPDIVLCVGPLVTCAEWCKVDAAKPKIVVVTKELVNHMGMETFAKLGLGNVVCAEELHEMYPFVGNRWDGSVEDLKVMLAMLFHFGRSFPVTNPTGRDLRGLRLGTELITPQPLWFVTQYYKAQSPTRRAEIDTCLEKNEACEMIDKIVLLNETALKTGPKIEEKVIGKRLTYADVIRWIYDSAPRDIMVAFANADIYIDASWRTLWSTDLETIPKFLALLRWDVGAETKIFGPRADSQDTWVLSSNAVKAVTWDWAALDFPFGQGGCDNAITLELFKKKFLVANPALTLKTYHLHTSGLRTYDPRNVVQKPAFLYIQPTGLHDMRPVKDVPGTPLKLTPFERRIKGPLSAAQARTFCSMVARSTQGVKLEADGPNLWSPEPVPISELTDTFYTRDGLAYTYDTLLVGKAKASAEAWANSRVSFLAASILVDEAAIVPLPDAVASNPSRYVLEYMSKVFLLRRRSPSAEFWCSRDPKCGEVLRMFSWPSKEIPVIAREENQQAWCTKALMWPYQDSNGISKEEIGALRGALGLGGWIPSLGKQLVIVVDDTWITQEVAEAIETAVEPYLTVKLVWAGRTSLETTVRALRGAWGILSKDDAAWSWVLPHSAYVWEVQSEMEPSVTLLHTAAAAELEHRLTIVPKGTPTEKDLTGLAAKLSAAILAEFGPRETPKLLMPAGHTGFFAHAGDSFREIAQEWGRRGYVKVEPSSCSNIWLGGVGETLLYDRPTLEWLKASPPEEQAWKTALMGNPASETPWTFWPRRPLLVEAAAQQPLKPWEARKGLVFYGRSENPVQLSRRGGAWSTVCDEFVHVQGSAPYPYTHSEYLERLGAAKYGLCLAGYGLKCHREIECMAMGCVPVCAPEVDITYAEPPVEGLHYLRAADPAAAKAAIENITPDRWMVMSVACRDWWKRNCSVDGAWELTQRLSGAQSRSALPH